MPYRAITVDHTQCGSADSANFPVLFAGVYSWLATTANGGRVASASGFDIVPYADSALTTKLNFERVAWNAATGAIEMWVQVPTLSAATNTVFYLSYGNSAVTVDQQNITGTWSGSFALAFHLNDNLGGSAPQIKDSASNTQAMTIGAAGNGGTLATVAGRVGSALGATPGSEYNFNFVSMTLSGMGTGSSTVSGWYYRNTDDHTGFDGPGFLWGRPNGSYPYAAFYLRLEKAGGVSIITGSEGDVIGPTPALATGSWHHLAVTENTGTGAVTIYVDGAVGYATSNFKSLRDANFQIAGSYNGIFDEIRAASVARSASWILAEYNNQNAPASFYAVGAETSGAVRFTLTGIATAEAFGTLTAKPVIRLGQTGIGSAEAFGSPTTRQTVRLALSGIGSAEAFGTETTKTAARLVQAGIASAEAFGTETTRTFVRLVQTGIASAEAFGTAVTRPAARLVQSGIGSAEAFGSPIVIPHSPATFTLTGIATAEAFGTPLVRQNSRLLPTAIGSAEAFGAVTVVPHSPQRVLLLAIGSAEAFGAGTVRTFARLLQTGIASAEAFGAASARASIARPGTPISTAEAFGAVTVRLGTARIGFAGIPSAEAFGRRPTVGYNQRLALGGIGSTEAFGYAPLLSTAFARTVTFPNGQTLTSWALSPAQLNTILQTLTCQMLGLDPTIDTTAYAKVRLSWPTGGQPGWRIDEDICFLKVTEEEDAYSRNRDRSLLQVDGQTISSTDSYTRVWRVSWLLYGPNSFDNARLLRSALLTTDFPHDTAAGHNLFFLTDMAATTRAPELFGGQWWDRTDFSVKLNELVTETLTVPSIASADVKILNYTGQIAEVNLT